MPLTLEQASEMVAQRDESFVACDMDAYMALWSEACTVEGPEHRLEGLAELRAAIQASWDAMRPLRMETRSLAVEGDAMYYEFSVVWEVLESGHRMLFTGMTWHRVDDDGRWCECREYFDPVGTPRASAAESPAVAELLA